MGFRAFRVSGFGFRFWGVSGFSGFEFRVSDFGFRVSGVGFRVWSLGFGLVREARVKELALGLQLPRHHPCVHVTMSTST